MSRKTLLTESEIRKFLKLANLGAVGDAKIQEMYGVPGARDEEEDEEMPGEEEMDMGAPDEEGDMEMDMGAADEPDMDMDAAADGATDSGMVSVDDFMGALESALEDVMGEPTSVEMDMGDDEPETDDELEMDMGGEPEMDMGPDDEEEEMPMMEQAAQDKVVNEVARRVAARLAAKNKNNQLVDQLAERILGRLTNK
tara:strand:+ start:1187 stop:1780 length:594 start_codon:yes stop_codon:yes gene_type:complete